jgi:hypothetical protein
MKGLVFSSRERRLALAAGVLIAGWLLTSLVVRPLWMRGRDLRVQVDTLHAKLAAFSRLVTSGPSVEQAYASYAGYVESGDEERARGLFLNELETLSRQAPIALNLKPRSVKQEERLSRFEVELDAEGAQPAVLSFLDAVLRLPRLITIDRLRLSSVPAKAGTLRANLVIQQVLLRQ